MYNKEKYRRRLRVEIRPRYSTRNRNPALLYAFLVLARLKGVFVKESELINVTVRTDETEFTIGF